MEQLSRSEMVKQMKRQNRFKNMSPKTSNTFKKSVTNLTDYNEENRIDSQENKSFQLRIVLASFLFLLFLGMKEKGLQFQDFNYQTIIEVISNNSGMDNAVAATKIFTEEIVITTFNSLD